MLLDFQFLAILNLLVVLLLCAATPYLGTRAPEAGARWPVMNVWSIIMLLLTIGALVLDVVYIVVKVVIH